MRLLNIWTFLILGLILRLIIVFWSFSFSQNPDLLRHRDWGRISFLYGISKTYDSKYITYGEKSNNLPPGSTYIISGSYYTSIEFSKIILKIFHLPEGSNKFINIYLVDFFLKLPAILSDLILSYFIYLIVKFKKDIKNAFFASALFLFNPVVLYNSAIWGQIDSLNNLAFIISLYCLINKKIFLSIFFCFASLYLKLSLLPVLPLYLFFLYLYKINVWKLLKYAFISILIFFILTILFFPNIFQWLDLFVLNNFRQEANLITVNAFNFWYFIFLPFFPNIIFPSNLSIYLIAYFIFATLCLPLFIIMYKKRNKLKTEYFFLFFSLISLLVFLFLPRMHERYLYPLFPFLAISVGLDRKLIFLYFVLSFFHLLNLLFVWHPMFTGIFSSVITNSWLGWLSSLGIIILGIIFYKKIFNKV